jgi:hypothetical protein
VTAESRDPQALAERLYSELAALRVELVFHSGGHRRAATLERAFLPTFSSAF